MARRKLSDFDLFSMVKHYNLPLTPPNNNFINVPLEVLNSHVSNWQGRALPTTPQTLEPGDPRSGGEIMGQAVQDHINWLNYMNTGGTQAEINTMNENAANFNPAKAAAINMQLDQTNKGLRQAQDYNDMKNLESAEAQAGKESADSRFNAMLQQYTAPVSKSGYTADYAARTNAQVEMAKSEAMPVVNDPNPNAENNITMNTPLGPASNYTEPTIGANTPFSSLAWPGPVSKSGYTPADANRTNAQAIRASTPITVNDPNFNAENNITNSQVNRAISAMQALDTRSNGEIMGQAVQDHINWLNSVNSGQQNALQQINQPKTMQDLDPATARDFANGLADSIISQGGGENNPNIDAISRGQSTPAGRLGINAAAGKAFANRGIVLSPTNTKGETTNELGQVIAPINDNSVGESQAAEAGARAGGMISGAQANPSVAAAQAVAAQGGHQTGSAGSLSGVQSSMAGESSSQSGEGEGEGDSGFGGMFGGFGF